MADLAQAVQGAVGQPASVRVGTVDSINPLVISAQGVPFEDVGVLESYSPQVGDTVPLLGQCSETGSDPASWLALGAARSTPDGMQAGQALVTFVAQTGFTQAVVFDRPFPAAPAVSTNIASGAAATAQWHSRAISVTTTGFTIFVFTAGIAASWTDVPVQWQAQPRTQ